MEIQVWYLFDLQYVKRRSRALCETRPEGRLWNGSNSCTAGLLCMEMRRIGLGFTVVDSESRRAGGKSAIWSLGSSLITGSSLMAKSERSVGDLMTWVLVVRLGNSRPVGRFFPWASSSLRTLCMTWERIACRCSVLLILR